jgi:hypothetical protein
MIAPIRVIQAFVDREVVDLQLRLVVELVEVSCKKMSNHKEIA